MLQKLCLKNILVSECLQCLCSFDIYSGQIGRLNVEGFGWVSLCIGERILTAGLGWVQTLALALIVLCWRCWLKESLGVGTVRSLPGHPLGGCILPFSIHFPVYRKSQKILMFDLIYILYHSQHAAGLYSEDRSTPALDLGLLFQLTWCYPVIV